LRKFIGIVALSLILVMAIPPAASAPVPPPVLEVKRHITIGDWGTVVFNDTLTILNNGTSPANDLLYGVPRSSAEGLRYILAKSSASVLQVDHDVEKDATFYWYRINFKEPLQPGKNATVNIASIRSDVIKFFMVMSEEGVEQLYQATFSSYPILKVRAGACNVTVYTSWDASFQLPVNSTFLATKIDGKPVLAASRKPLEPLTDEKYSFNFSSSSQRIVQCDWAKRKISLSPTGEVSVSDSYRLNNLAASFSSVRILLPKETAEVMAYDDSGPLWAAPKKTSDVTIGPRFTNVRQNESFTFRLEYKLSAGKGVKQLEWWGLYNLNIRLTTDTAWMIQKEEVSIVLPRGVVAEASSIPQGSKTESSTYETVLTYSYQPLTPLHDIPLNLKYRYLPFWSGLVPLMWLLLIEVVVTAVIAVSKVQKPVKTAPTAPIERILQFVELYDEKTALRLELDKLEQDLARGAMSRHEHRRRGREIEMRSEEIRKELQVVKTALSAASAKYDDMFRRTERAEAEIDSARASAAQLRSQYRSGKMTRQVYDSMISDVRKRQDRAKGTINSIIITLREETR